MGRPEWATGIAVASLVVTAAAVGLLVLAVRDLDRDPSPVAVRPHARRREGRRVTGLSVTR